MCGTIQSGRGLMGAGAANFSRSGETEQDNDLILLRGPRACDAFERDFEAMWKREGGQ